MASAMAKAMHLDAAGFEKALGKSGVLVADFWAGWCGPCRMLSPVLDEIAESSSDVKVAKVNVDEQPELARRFGIMSIPTLLLFKNGEVVNKSIGVQPKAAILQMMAQ